MTAHHTSRVPRTYVLLAALIATCALAFVALGATAQRAEAYWVCSPTSPVTRAAGFRCQYGTYRPTIAYVEKNSTPRAYAVYRSSTAGGGSISGSEYYSPTADYFLQAFHCNPGYPNAHNRHTIPVFVTYTLAGSC